MPVSAAERIAKYKAKFDASVVGTRYTATKTLAESKQEVRQAELAQLRTDIRTILNENGISPLFTTPYLSFAMKLYGLQNSGASPSVLQGEVEALGNLWIARGCTKAVVNDIIVYFGYSPIP